VDFSIDTKVHDGGGKRRDVVGIPESVDQDMLANGGETGLPRNK